MRTVAIYYVRLAEQMPPELWIECLIAGSMCEGRIRLGKRLRLTGFRGLGDTGIEETKIPKVPDPQESMDSGVLTMSHRSTNQETEDRWTQIFQGPKVQELIDPRFQISKDPMQGFHRSNVPNV